MAPETVEIVPLVALTLGAIGLGGGLYETLLVDPVWPRNPAMIQPVRGGLDRKRFWGPIHALFEIALLVSAWTAWSEAAARPWIVVALSAHFVARAWSLAYFIPRALRFEKMGDLSEEQVRLARRWTRLSRCRPLLELVSIASLGALVFHLGRG
jgi:hypothetical protein